MVMHGVVWFALIGYYYIVLPTYVYQGDMVQGVEELRTPLRDILHIEFHVRGTIVGFMVSSFVVDLPEEYII